MGKKDTVSKNYMSISKYFADAFNATVFGGKQMVHSDELHLEEKDPTELGIVITEDTKEILQKVRDVLKKSIIMSNGKTTFLMLGIENQSEVHYAMPVRNLLYDALNYSKQVSRIAAIHKEQGDVRDAEFLSGFAKGDRIIPVITLTVYWGSGKWDGPRSLKDMFPGDMDEEFLNEVEDYKMHLLVPSEIEDYTKFTTDFGKAMKYIAVSDNEEEINKLRSDKDFEKVDVETVRVINEVTGSNIRIKEGEEVVNMCKGLRDLLDHEAAEAAAKATVKSTAETLVENVNNMMKNLGWSLENVCKAIGVSVDKYEEANALLKK